jgi:hypothetical protein
MRHRSWSHKEQGRERYYLLPGMGGSAYRRKRKLIWQWSIAAGILTSAALAAILYLLSR